MSMNISIKKILAVLTPLGAGLDSTILEEIEQNAGFRLPMDYRRIFVHCERCIGRDWRIGMAASLPN